MANRKSWQRGGEWSNHGLRESAKGYVAYLDSRISGDRTGVRRLITWSEVERLGYSQDSDLYAEHSAGCSVGDYLYACSDPRACRILRRGHIVQ
jgi:hypothetical protein